MNTMANTMVIENVIENNNNVRFLSELDLMNKVPYAFATEPTSDAVTEKYVFTSTNIVRNDMAELGWEVVRAGQGYRRSYNGKTTNYFKGTSLHELVFQTPELAIYKKVVDENGVVSKKFECAPTITLTNSHDGKHSFQFIVGFTNGIITNSRMTIRHIHYDFNELRNVINEIVRMVPTQVEVMNKMQKRALTIDEIRALALSAIRFRRNDDEFELNDDILDEIATNENGNMGSTLWEVLNDINANILKGGFKVPSPKTGRLIKARGIKAIGKRIALSSKLYAKALEFVAE